MLKRFCLVALAGLALLSSPSIAQSKDDVRCLVLSNGFAAKANNDAAKKIAQSAAFYYLGRIDGRWNDAELRTAIAQEGKALNAATAGPAMQACAKKMQDSARKLQGMSPKRPNQLLRPSRRQG